MIYVSLFHFTSMGYGRLGHINDILRAAPMCGGETRVRKWVLEDG